MTNTASDASLSSILVVDDESAIREIYSEAIRMADFICYEAESGYQALDILAHKNIDVVITDIRMPEMSGIDLLKRIKDQFNASVIVMTGFAEDFSYEDVVTLGASDFIQKPVNIGELQIRLKRVIHEQALVRQRNQAHQELKDAYLDTINRLVTASEYKDEDTGDHILRINRYSSLVAEKLGKPQEYIDEILYASPMHDVGKIGIPDAILLKPGRLTQEEFEIMKSHTTIGGRILKDAKSAILNMAQEIALTHHERWDGKGYPQGLAGTDIPLCGRIVAIVDTFDALTSARPYKKPYPLDVALKIIREERGKQFDPEITDIFLENIDAMVEIRQTIASMGKGIVDEMEWSERDIASGLNVSLFDE